MYQFHDAGSGGGAAALSFDRPFTRPVVARGFGARLQSLPLPQDLDLIVDLGVRIGSKEWLRGLLTCGALCYSAFALAPGLEPLIGASPAPWTEAQREQVSALSFGPLAYGADTGRRMAPTDAVRPLTDTPERPSIEVQASIGRGDGFARMLERAGVGGSEAKLVEAMIADTVSLGDIRPGTGVDLILGRRPNRSVARPLDALALRARFDLRLTVVRIDGQLVLKTTPIAVDNTPLRIQGRVGTSLYRAARASGAPGKAVEGFLRAIASQVNVGTLSAGDRFDIIIEHRRAETGETETGKLLYAGLDRASGKDLQLMQWTAGGSTQWYEASGVGRQSGSLQRPVPGRVSSNFGMRRHPILGYSRMHKGMDFRAGYGTPILAATDGRVARAGWAGGYGKQVRLNHAGGIATSYSHMSRIVAQPGQAVRQGQVIGYVGSTGLSTGPHLHYEMYRNGAAVNPASVTFVQRAQLSGGDLAAFRARIRALLSTPVGAADTRSAAVKTPKSKA